MTDCGPCMPRGLGGYLKDLECSSTDQAVSPTPAMDLVGVLFLLIRKINLRLQHLAKVLFLLRREFNLSLSIRPFSFFFFLRFP